MAHARRAASILFSASLCLVLLPAQPGSTAGAAGRRPAQVRATCQPLLNATFLQPSYSVLSWSPARVDRELTDMTAVGIKSVILQWSVDMDARQSYYPTSSTKYPASANLVGPLLAAAGAHGAQVWLGLGNVYAWQVHAADDVWLTNQVMADEHIANELNSAYGNRIAGWYISNEVDDVLLSGAPTAEPIHRFLNTLSGYLHTHAGRHKVMSSPTYSGLHQSPAPFAASVRTVMGGIDIVNVQDGGGSGYIAASDITRWFLALRDALANTSMTIWQDADMYGPAGGPINPLALQNNLRATCGLVAARSGFSFTSQMGPADLGTSVVYDAYRTFRNNVTGAR